MLQVNATKEKLVFDGASRQISALSIERRAVPRSGTNLLKIAIDDALAFNDAFQTAYEAAGAGAQGNERWSTLFLCRRRDVFANLT